MSNFLKLLNPLKSDKANQHCNICNASFTLTLKSYECAECYSVVCAEHTNNSPTDDPVCDSCLRGRIKKELNIEYTYQLSSMKKELTELKAFKGEKRKGITSMDSRINALQDQVRSEEKLHIQKTEEIERQTTAGLEYIKQLDEEEKVIRNQTDESLHNTKLLKEKLNTINEALQSRKFEKSGLEREVDKLNDEMTTLLDKNRELITYQRVRTMSCAKCHKVMKHKFKEQIIEILKFEGKEEMIASLLEEESSKVEPEKIQEDVTKNICACEII